MHKMMADSAQLGALMDYMETMIQENVSKIA
jgi:hypothetical protein